MASDNLQCLFTKNLLLNFISKAILTWIKLRLFLIKSTTLKLPTLKWALIHMARSITLILTKLLLLILVKIYRDILTTTRIKGALMSNLSVMVRTKLITSLILFIKEGLLLGILKSVSQLVELKIFTGMAHLILIVKTERMSLAVWWLVEIRIFRVIVRNSLIKVDTMGILRWIKLLIR